MQNIPKLLYKYRCLNEYTKRILTHGEIYFSKLTELNDPFEYYTTFKNSQNFTLSDQEIQELQPKEKISESVYNLSPEERTRYYFKHIRKMNSGVFCLSEDPASLYMYAHYADSYKGICLGFDSDVFKEDGRSLLMPMNYDNFSHVINDDVSIAEEFDRAFRNKPIIFSSEKEWRVRGQSGILTDGCDLLIVEEDPKTTLSISKFPTNFVCGFVYNLLSEENYTNFWYFDRNKREKPLKPLCLENKVVASEIMQLKEYFRCKRKSPVIEKLSNTELAILNKIPIGGSSNEKFYSKPVFIEPYNIRKSIKEIIFGFNISQKDVDEILAITKDIQPKFLVAKPQIGGEKGVIVVKPYENYERDIKQWL